jgi:hypothetical protein
MAGEPKAAAPEDLEGLLVVSVVGHRRATATLVSTRRSGASSALIGIAKRAHGVVVDDRSRGRYH